jgi:hypothetical protein
MVEKVTLRSVSQFQGERRLVWQARRYDSGKTTRLQMTIQVKLFLTYLDYLTD